ncbi:hypothetical protein TWF694_003195 [Orbilia ellipsospora]|uniref:Uncharacterized protein n=1 Tax=Orbilia ellipsospora TaxID=2528407 RepID=A0AAV9X3D8_9PEZI
MPPSHIAYYISSDNLGHAARASQLCNCFLLVDNTVSITLITQVTLQSFSIFKPERVDWRQVKVESTVVHHSLYELDVSQSIANLICLEQDVIMAREISWLGEHGVDLVLVDAPHLPCLAASKVGIMCVLVTNFGFAEVFSYFQGMTDGKPETKMRLDVAVGSMIKAYHCADLWMRLPGWLPNPGFLRTTLPSSTWIVDDKLELGIENNIFPPYSVSNPSYERKIVDTPLLARPPTGISETDLFKALGIPTQLFGNRVLLLLLQITSHPPQIPPNWICVTLWTPKIPLPNGYFVAPSDLHTPDIIKISSCVLGRLGYGAVSEAIAAGVPYVYVPKPYFIGEYSLRHLVETWPGYEGRAERLETQKFEDGLWWPTVLELVSRKKKGEDSPCVADNGEFIRQTIIEEWDHWQHSRN